MCVSCGRLATNAAKPLPYSARLLHALEVETRGVAADIAGRVCAWRVRGLQRLVAELETLNASAARSLEEGMDETLTLHRLGLHEELRRSLNTTNLIESIMAQIERKTQRVDHWRTSDQPQRWCAATLLQIEQNFRRVRGGKHLPLLQTALTNKLRRTAA